MFHHYNFPNDHYFPGKNTNCCYRASFALLHFQSIVMTSRLWKPHPCTIKPNDATMTRVLQKIHLHFPHFIGKLYYVILVCHIYITIVFHPFISFHLFSVAIVMSTSFCLLLFFILCNLNPLFCFLFTTHWVLWFLSLFFQYRLNQL